MPSRRSFLSQLGLLAAVGGGAWWVRSHVLWPEPEPRFQAGGSSGWITFPPAPGVPIVTVIVNGSPVQALLDSGAQSSVIDRALAERLGLATTTLAPFIVAVGVSGSAQLGRAADLDLTVGDLVLKGMRAAVFELAPIAAASRRPFELILGQDLLKVVVADVDFPGNRLAFHAPDRFTPPQGARALQVKTRGGEMRVPIRVEATTLEAVIDTGSSGVLAVSQQAAMAAGLLTGRRLTWADSITFGGVSRDPVVQVQTVAFAGETFRDVAVHVFTPSQGAPLPAGLLGVEAFAGFRLILDASRSTLYLVEASRSSKRRR